MCSTGTHTAVVLASLMNSAMAAACGGKPVRSRSKIRITASATTAQPMLHAGFPCLLSKHSDLRTVQRDVTTLDITELPLRKWTQDYKEMLEVLVKPEDRTAPALIEVRWIAEASQDPPIAGVTSQS